MELILLNVFLITVFTKDLLSFGILGLNFAPWDVFLLYPIIRHKLFHRYHMRRIHIILCLFVIIATLTTLFNFAEGFSYIGLLLQIIRNVFIMDLFYRLGTRFDQSRFVNTITIWAILIPTVHLIAYYSPLQSAITESSIGNFMRLEGFVGDANFFAFSVLLLTLAVTKYRIFVLFLILPCILLSGSRTGLALWCLLFYVFFRNYRIYMFLTFFLSMLIFKGSIMAYLEKYEQIFSMFSRSLVDFSRIRYWIEAYSKMDGHYLFGHGIKSFVYNIGNFSHNDFITAVYEYGVLGLITFITVVFAFLRLPFPKRFGRNLDLQAAYYSIFLLLNLFSFWLYPHIWILQGTLLGITYSKNIYR